jgi:hypothetical protein
VTARGPRTPDAGRIHDALLSGTDDFAEDREADLRLVADRAPCREQHHRFSGGAEMVPPGLCDVAAWHAKPGPGRPGWVLFLGGIGRKRDADLKKRCLSRFPRCGEPCHRRGM